MENNEHFISSCSDSCRQVQGIILILVMEVLGVKVEASENAKCGSGSDAKVVDMKSESHVMSRRCVTIERSW